MPEAARVDDQVQHSDAFPGLLTGLLVGALIGVAIVATGGGAIVVLAAAATVATSASLGATAGELLGSLCTDPAGPIRTGVDSVIIGPEHRIAATVFSYVDCDQHDSNVQVAEGSATVWIGAAGQYAARVGDQGTCGFKIAEGCATVIIGGPTATGAGLSVGNEVPQWAQGLVLVLGLAGGGLGLAAKGLTFWPIVARLGAGLVGGFAGGEGGYWLGGKWFGEGSLGQKLMGLGGGVLGAVLGEGLAGRRFPTPQEAQARTARQAAQQAEREAAQSSGFNKVRTTDSTGTTRGWGGFDVDHSNSWKSRHFDVEDKAMMTRVSQGLQKIDDLDPDAWSTLSEAERKAAIRQSVNETMDAMGIPKSRRPQIKFTNDPAGDYGGAYWDVSKPRGELEINLAKEPGDVVGTVVHESRHYYQSWQAYQSEVMGRDLSTLHPDTSKWITNMPEHGGYYDDGSGGLVPNTSPYFTQPLEQDAETFGRRTLDLLPYPWR